MRNPLIIRMPLNTTYGIRPHIQIIYGQEMASAGHIDLSGDTIR